MKKTKKWLLVTGALALCAIACVLIFPGHKATPQSHADGNAETEGAFMPIDQITPFGTLPPVAPDEERSEDPIAVTAPVEPELQNEEPDEPAQSEPEVETPTEKPDTAAVVSSAPDKPATSSSSSEAEKPEKAKDSAPKSGDKNDKGEVFIPGFGWVKDEGGGGVGEISVGEGSMDKMVGR